jgi:hypothetical protein
VAVTPAGSSGPAGDIDLPSSGPAGDVDEMQLRCGTDLLEALAEVKDAMLGTLVVKEEVIERFRMDLEDAHVRFQTDLLGHVRRSSPRFQAHLAILASLYKRIYLGCDVERLDTLKSSREDWMARILSFFVYFQYPIDLEMTPSKGIIGAPRKPNAAGTSPV